MNRRIGRWLARFLFALALSAASAYAADEITPAQWLAAQPKPRFRPGHSLPPLTRFGWVLPLDARIELTEHWGYALEFGGYTTDDAVRRAFDQPQSDEAKMVALTASDPKKYPLCIILCRDLPANPLPETWTRNAKGEFLGGKDRLWSPEAPMSVLQEAAELRARPLRKLREKVPVAMVLNGGEYALTVPGFGQKTWQQDPQIVSAKGEKDWHSYISEKKAMMETVIAEAVRKADPDRVLYVYYTAGGGTDRNRYPNWQQWAHGFQWMRTASDLPSDEHYYSHFNDGWTGNIDMLTQALNARGRELRFGARFSYDWLCAGWKLDPPPRPPTTNRAAAADAQTGKLGDLRRYTGFLKCMYTAGMLGGNAGYYAYPRGGFAAEFPSDRPPHWLQQMTRLAHVHAFFSYHDQFIRESDLLPGPKMHRWSKDQPAYELPTGDPTVRVLARKHQKDPRWLVTAWAADGPARSVNVEIPDLGIVRVLARPEGSVYDAQLKGDKPSMQLLDRNGMQPTL